MKIQNYQFPKSSFLSVQKDSEVIISKMLKNENLKKLLFYSDKNCLALPNLDQPQTYSLINNQIKLVPKIKAGDELISYVIITYSNFTPNAKNPEYRDCLVTFDIVCHMDYWSLGDFKLRPYMIAGEVDSMFDKSHLFGIGKLDFAGANQIVLNEEFSGISLIYKAIHGEEDRVQ